MLKGTANIQERCSTPLYIYIFFHFFFLSLFRLENKGSSRRCMS